MPKKKAKLKEVLTKVTENQHQIFSVAEEKIAREKRLEYIKENYFLVCVEAKMCPICGSEKATIRHITVFHERMCENEYDHTRITCHTCGKITKVYIQ